MSVESLYNTDLLRASFLKKMSGFLGIEMMTLLADELIFTVGKINNKRNK